MNWVANAVLFVLPFLAVEALFRLLPVCSPPHILPVSAHAPVARFQPNVDYVYSRDWNFSIREQKRSNNFGYIHTADYRQDAHTPLLVVIGDSYVEAHAIPAGMSVAERLHSQLDGGGRVYSLGLSGAPLSQYLVFADFARERLRPQAMAFVIISNDFDESLLKYKSDPRFHYFTEKGVLRRVDYEMSTTKKVLRESAFLRYLVLHLEPARALEGLRQSLRRPPDSTALASRNADSKRAIDYFLDQLPSKSGLSSEWIVFVLDAVRPAMYSASALAQADDGYHAQMRAYFSAQASARGYGVLDMQPAFIERHRLDGSKFELAPTDSHWNALAHRIAAERIQQSATFVRLFGADTLTMENERLVRTGQRRIAVPAQRAR